MTSTHTHDQECRYAAIVDGDNLTRGGELAVPTARSVMDAVAIWTEGWPTAFAMQRRQAQRYMTAYADHGWGIHFASMAPDASDEVLLEEASFFLDHGVTDLWVASGDHAFAALARHARLHVLAYRGNLSRRLQMAATTVDYLDVLAPAA
jgi:hypothetical protein